ncbi:DNA polymerase III subunit beta [Longispora albida]|uniref:DNA polymerase III subunit beta n=1 Tax=Longispora albida TaxID=203523 RepID=UPI00036F9470|nr:DNA polymerase III subunit beta [Longispora albida]
MPLNATFLVSAGAAAASRVARLLPERSLSPYSAGVLVRGGREGLTLLGTDGELSAEARIEAAVHEDGEVMVSRRGLAALLAALGEGDAHLSAEGSRLTVRTPGGRFTLPALSGVSGLPALGMPPAVGTVDGRAWRAALAPVAGAASREHALPIFTGVRMWSGGGKLRLLATDRFRLARAALPWEAAGEVDVLVSAPLLVELAKQGAGNVTLHSGAGRFGLSWERDKENGCSVAGPVLGAAFPHAQAEKLLAPDPSCVAEVDPGSLAAAVTRAALSSGPHGRITVETEDGELVVRAADEQGGESRESVKATVHGDRLTRTYQARYLLDALRAFGGEPVRAAIQPDLRPTVFTTAQENTVDLTYLVVPMQQRPS